MKNLILVYTIVLIGIVLLVISTACGPKTQDPTSVRGTLSNPAPVLSTGTGTSTSSVYETHITVVDVEEDDSKLKGYEHGHHSK